MCGIVGVVSREPVEQETVERMRDLLAHRGPDAAGCWSGNEGRVCLGHRRLAVIDPTPDADQPFTSPDGRHVITFNGEIYNFRALRAELAAAGSRFHTDSDTEVLLESYRRFGPGCLDRLSGMFAFAIWDSERCRLFCARDPAGEKPFYYAQLGNSFVFASEPKALLQWPEFHGQVDWTAVADYLTFGFIPDPKAIWTGMRKLPPGHAMTIDLGTAGPRLRPPVAYWDMSLEPDPVVEDWGPAIRQALVEAASEMSYAEVPVGAFLSGGVDSATVAAALARSGHDVRTFTIGFDEPEFDERAFARQAAAVAHTRHTERVVRPVDVESVFRETILWHFDEPFADYSYLPTYYVCREARDAITVALTGDGGDELFAGYGKYALLARRAEVERALTRRVTRLLARAGAAVATQGAARRLRPYRLGDEQLLLWTLTTGTSPERLRGAARGPLARALADYDPMDVLRPHLRRAPPGEVGLVNAMRYLDLKLTLGAGILTKVDRAAMSVSLETRPVFLNRRILDLAGRIPPNALADSARPKKLLRSAVAEWLPPSLLERPKAGFALPLGRWLGGDLRALAEPAVDGVLDEVIAPGFAGQLVDEHARGNTEHTAELHNLIFLGHWLDRWVANPRRHETLVL